MDPILARVSVFGYWAGILGTYGGPGRPDRRVEGVLAARARLSEPWSTLKIRSGRVEARNGSSKLEESRRQPEQHPPQGPEMQFGFTMQPI